MPMPTKAPYVPPPFVVGNRPTTAQVLADTLRATANSGWGQTRSPTTVVTEGFGAAPPQVVRREGAGTWNAIKDVMGIASGMMDASAERDYRQQQQRAVADAVNDPNGIDKKKMLALSQMGVDADTLKLIAPEKENELGMNQIAQYGQTPAGMRTINQLKPGTFSDEYIKQAEADQQARMQKEQEDKIRVARESRAPRNPTEFEMYQQNPDAYAKFKMAGKSTGGGGVPVFNPETGEFEMSGGKGPAPSMTNQDRKFAMENSDLADKAAVQGDSIKRITGRMVEQADPKVQDKLAQIAANNDFTSIATMLRTPGAFANASEITGLAIGDARALAPVSNTDFDKLLSRFPNALTDPKQGAALFDELGRISKGAEDRSRANATFYSMRADGLIPPGMSEASFRSKIARPPADFPEEQKKYWDKLPADERVKQHMMHGGF